MNSWRVLTGDALERLRELDAGSVQTCVTSPPYFGLRDYGTADWNGGDPACDHQQGRPGAGRADGVVDDRAQRNRDGVGSMGGDCKTCGATRTDSQLGLEATPDEYVARLVEVFREVRRVLRDDGTLWLNLGDSYASGGMSNPSASSTLDGGKDRGAAEYALARAVPAGCKPKDLLGIPWMVAFALRADGWYLRSDIIWAKPNPMPESVTDRPTKAHEFLFLLSKSPRYFYDADSIREEVSPNSDFGGERGRVEDMQSDWMPSAVDTRQKARLGNGSVGDPSGRNKRSVWTVATQPFPGAHFAVFPPKLIEPCVLAGSAEDACGVCGAPWERVVERETQTDYHLIPHPSEGARDAFPGGSEHQMGQYRAHGDSIAGPPGKTVGWQPSCDHEDKTASSTVLDPFAGAGTTGLVATRLGRSFIGIELNPEYAEMARERIRDDAPLMNYLLEGAA